MVNTVLTQKSNLSFFTAKETSNDPGGLENKMDNHFAIRLNPQERNFSLPGHFFRQAMVKNAFPPVALRRMHDEQFIVFMLDQDIKSFAEFVLVDIFQVIRNGLILGWCGE